MSGDTCLELWLHEYKMEALEKVLEEQGSSVEKQMQDHLIELYSDMVPSEIQQGIRQRIDAEHHEEAVRAEANRRFAVFKVTEHGEQSCYLVDEPIDFLRAARSLRNHLRAQNPPTDYRHHYAASREITPEEFEQHSITRAENPKRVTGAFEIDLDHGEFASLDAEYGWKLYKVKDVCAAAYRADRKQYMSDSYYQYRFAECLAGKEQTLQEQTAPRMSIGQTM